MFFLHLRLNKVVNKIFQNGVLVIVTKVNFFLKNDQALSSLGIVTFNKGDHSASVGALIVKY